MTFLCDAGYLVVLLRPKNEVKPLTKSTEMWICMRKWPVPISGILFLRLQKGPRRSDFFRGFVCYQCGPCKKLSKNSLREAKKKINTVSNFFDFHENDYNLAHFWAWPNFNSFANFGLLMFAFCHLTGGRNKYRKITIY